MNRSVFSSSFVLVPGVSGRVPVDPGPDPCLVGVPGQRSHMFRRLLSVAGDAGNAVNNIVLEDWRDDIQQNDIN